MLVWIDQATVTNLLDSTVFLNIWVSEVKFYTGIKVRSRIRKLERVIKNIEAEALNIWKF